MSYQKVVDFASILYIHLIIVFSIFDNPLQTVTDDYTWTWQNYTVDNSGNSLIQKWTAIASNVAGDRMAAVVNGGYIYTYYEENDVWSPTSTVNTWVSISSSDDGRVLAAVANGEYVYISESYGTTWIKQVDLGIKKWRAIKVSPNGKKFFAIDDDGYVFQGVASEFSLIWSEQSYGQRARWHALTLVERIAMFTFLLNNGKYNS